MKVNLLFFFFIMGIGCVPLSSFQQCPTIVKVLEKTFRDDFFKQYKTTEGKLLIIVKDKKLYREVNQCKFKKMSFSIDTLELDREKYLRLEEYIEINNTIRLQISCHDYRKTNMLYSTSYKKVNERFDLNKDVSPYITED